MKKIIVLFIAVLAASAIMGGCKSGDDAAASAPVSPGDLANKPGTAKTPDAGATTGGTATANAATAGAATAGAATAGGTGTTK